MIKNGKKWLVLTLSVLLILVLGACGKTSSTEKTATKNNPSSIEAIKKRGHINVAVFGDLSPYGYLDKDGKNQGYDIYLAHRLAKDLLGDENKVKFVVVNAEERVDVLKSNKADLVLANFTKTKEREKVIDYADPYMKVAIGVVSPKSKEISKVSQLKNKKLIVNKGTTAEHYFTTEQKEVQLEKFESKSQQFQALTTNRGAALADDNSYLYSWVKANPDYVVGIKEVGPVSTINPAVKKGNTSLKKWVNQDLKKLNEEKFFHKAYDETLKPFFGEDISAEDIIVEGN